MENVNNFKDLIYAIPNYRKIILLIFKVKRGDSFLNKIGLSNDFIEKSSDECKQILDDEMHD